MYNRFPPPADEVLEELVHARPLATVITGSHISHLPLVLDKRGADWVLVGHLSRANPHWKALPVGVTTAVFHGPEAYITPLWYKEHDVPTWNYVVAHLSGTARLLESEPEIVAALRILSDRMEGKDGWQFSIPADLQGGRLAKAIVGFEIPVSVRTGNVKLGQNRNAADLAGVLEGLQSRRDEQSQQVREWMIRFAKKS